MELWKKSLFNNLNLKIKFKVLSMTSLCSCTNLWNGDICIFLKNIQLCFSVSYICYYYLIFEKQSLHFQAILNSSFHTNFSFVPRVTNIVCFFEMAGPFYYILRQCIIKSWAWITRAFLLLDLTKSDIFLKIWLVQFKNPNILKAFFLEMVDVCYILFYHRGYQETQIFKFNVVNFDYKTK